MKTHRCCWWCQVQIDNNSHLSSNVEQATGSINPHTVCEAVPGQSDDSTSVFNVIYENYEQSLEAFYCYYNINTISEGVWIQKDFRFVGRFIEHFFVSFFFLVTVFIASLFCSASLLIFLIFYAHALSNCVVFFLFIFLTKLDWNLSYT